MGSSPCPEYGHNETMHRSRRVQDTRTNGPGCQSDSGVTSVEELPIWTLLILSLVSRGRVGVLKKASKSGAPGNIASGSGGGGGIRSFPPLSPHHWHHVPYRAISLIAHPPFITLHLPPSLGVSTFELMYSKTCGVICLINYHRQDTARLCILKKKARDTACIE